MATFVQHTQQGRQRARNRQQVSNAASSRQRKDAQQRRRREEGQLRHVLGRCDVECPDCNALHWIEERKSRSSQTNPRFSICCADGKVRLPDIPAPDPELLELFTGTSAGEPSSSRKKQCRTPYAAAINFRCNIRTYNNLLSFCSVGATFDKDVWGPRSHRIVRLQGVLYHQIGALLPEPNDTPKFSQIYIMDGSSEDMAQIRASNAHGAVEKNTILRLQVITLLSLTV